MIPADILALIPGCQDRPPLDVHPLPGGRGCNLVLRVDTEAGRFVLRQRQPPLDRPGAAAQTELRSQLAAAAAGLAPRVIQAALDGSWLLMDFVAADLWTLRSAAVTPGGRAPGSSPCAIAQPCLPPALPPLDAAAIADGYLQQLHAREAGLVVQFRPLLQRVQDLSRAIDGLAARVVLNHGDLQVGNMLGPEPVLIDWEYAQLADPTYDIACLLTYYPPLESQLQRLLDCAGLLNPR